MKIATISSKKLGDANEGTLKNNNLYDDKELFDDADLNWYDYGFRNYDPQVGRFMQLDPLTYDYPELTPFQFSGDDPIANVDVDGLEPASAINLANKLASQGIKATMKVVEKGAYAGKWAVSWNTVDGIAHVVPFATKTVGISVARAGQLALTSLKVLSIKNTTITNCHGANLPGWNLSPGSGWPNLFVWLKGNGGGIRFTGEDGGNEETRDGYNADAQSEDISGIIRIMLNQKSNSTGLFDRKIPKGLVSPAVEKLYQIKKYIKGIAGVQERMEYFSGGQNEKLEPPEQKPFIINDTVGEGAWDHYIRNKNGTIVDAQWQSGDAPIRKKGQNGARDTIRNRIYKQPPPPKKDIPRRH